MRKTVAVLLILSMAVVGQAQVVFKPPSAGSATGVIPGTTTVGSCTNGVMYADPSSILQCSSSELAYFNAGAGNGVVTARKTPSGGAGTSNFFNATGTLTAPATSGANGALFSITSNGSSAFSQNALGVLLNSGYTGSAATAAISTLNSAAGTGTSTPNIGVGAQYNGTGAVGIGAYMSSASTVTNSGYGGVGLVQTNGTPQVGLMGWSGGSGSVTHGSGVLAVTSTTFPVDFNAAVVPFIVGKAALAATNTTSTDDIARFIDNTTVVHRVLDSGATWSVVGTKTLTDATATSFVRIAVTSNGRQGGIVEYCVDANDATLYQTRCGSVPFSLVNEAGTEACITGTASDADASPTGTLTVAFDGNSGAADTCDIRANATSSLTETTLRINYTVRLFGNAATAVTPQ